MYAEFVGLTANAIVLIERLRSSPEETKSEILERVLPNLGGMEIRKELPTKFFDFGQGVKLPVGERLTLFLSTHAKQILQSDGQAEIREDGFYMGGKKIHPSRGSVIDPAMKAVQKAKKHFNDKGEIISLSAWRQWHVRRDDRLVSLAELKDPALAHRRGAHNRKLPVPSLEELGL